MKNKKCRNCGNAEIEIKPSEIMKGFYAQCTKCEYSSASCKTKEIAVQDWNENN
jgi:hypothetical protein